MYYRTLLIIYNHSVIPVSIIAPDLDAMILRTN